MRISLLVLFLTYSVAAVCGELPDIPNQVEFPTVNVPASGDIIYPDKQVEAWRNKPLNTFGNLFNESVGALPESQKYIVIDEKSIAQPFGNEIWLKVTPHDSNAGQACQQEGCWVFYGQRKGALADQQLFETPNFKQETQ